MNRKSEYSNWRTGALKILLWGVILSPGLFAAERDIPVPDASFNRILDQTRKAVESFWEEFRSVTCVETLVQEKLGKQDSVDYSKRSAFDYLVLLNSDGDNLTVEESRLEQGKKKKDKNVPLLVTNGIPTLLLVFHPAYRECFRYRQEGEESAGGHRLSKIGFEHIPGARSTAAIRLRGMSHPLDIQGTAWVDPDTGAIHRIAAEIGAPDGALNLKALDMDVQYAACEFPDGGPLCRLPSIATVTIRSEHQQWRNVHRYSGYKRFTVKTEESVRK